MTAAAHQQFALPLRQAEEIERVARVLSVIRTHEGPNAAIRIDAIAAVAGVSYRDVQEITKYLVEERHTPIGTLWTKPYGYYIVKAEEDLGRNAWQFLQRGVSNIKHGRAYLKPELAGPIVGQLDLFVVTIMPFIESLESRYGRKR